MRKRYWVFIFLFVLLVHIAGIYTQNAVIEKITKPVLIVVLAACFISTTYKVSSGIKKWILVALFFSWVGDILLMFVDTSSVYFLAGLASFLVAHIFFIFFFHAVRLQEGIKGKIFLLIPVLIYYVILMEILSPGLGSMKLPVRIYGVFICFMLMLAIHMLYIRNRTAGLLMMNGALLFVISDSVLAINKFYITFEGAGIIIMLTYGIAQLLIVQGAIEYVVGHDKNVIQE